MATVPISITEGGGATAAAITNALRSDTRLPPAGVSFPIALTLSGSNWIGSFTDSTPPSFYIATAVYTVGGSPTQPGMFALYTASAATGYFTSQAAIEAYLGGINADLLSNLNNNTTGPSVAGFQNAIYYAEGQINYWLATYRYPTGVTSPQFPTTSYAWQELQRIATIIASCWLYAKRGYSDETKGLAGVFAKELADAMRDLKAILHNVITDVPRNITSLPQVILSPVVWPWGGTQQNILQSNWIPTVPGIGNQ